MQGKIERRKEEKEVVQFPVAKKLQIFYLQTHVITLNKPHLISIFFMIPRQRNKALWIPFIFSKFLLKSQHTTRKYSIELNNTKFI